MVIISEYDSPEAENMIRSASSLFALALFTLLASSTSLADVSEVDRVAREKSASETERILERLDLDRDGQLTALEIPAAAC